MKIVLSILLIIAAILVFIGLIFFNKKRAVENDIRGITWSNIKRQTDKIGQLSAGVEKAHIDEEYATKKFAELAAKDKVISIVSVAAMFMIVLSVILMLVGDA